MAVEYSVDLCSQLEQKIRDAGLHRPIRIKSYQPGTHLNYQVTSVTQNTSAKVTLVVERFVGGGFAGQVYQVRLLDIAPAGAIEGLEVGAVYAVKILVPASSFARLFRNLVYWVGFQGPFQLQVNPAAARAGALWQKFIRRAAAIRFGDQNAVVDIYATFVDENLGSCGELSEWVDGRTWRLEVDDRMDLLRRWCRGKGIDESARKQLGSPEYRAKRTFMHEFVRLLYEVGAYEFARQYEWSTCKSQPNCLKRKDGDDDPQAGLVAVDFRAGLALLPFLPMSPGDFKLILRGLLRGSLVQFDRGDLDRLEAFTREHADRFVDLRPMLEELKRLEDTYRDSVPDITHNHLRLLHSRKLWATMFDSAVTGWRVRGLVDDQHESALRRSRVQTFLFFLIGLIPLLGRPLRRIWCRPDWRKHYASALTSFSYLRRAATARVLEKSIDWHRQGRIGAACARRFAEQPWRYLLHLPCLLLIFPGLHRFLTDSQWRREKFLYLFVRPVRLYFNRQLREEWLREMVAQGCAKHMLSDEDARIILSRASDPFIQKYLKCLAVHLCTLPVTQIVSVAVAIIFVLAHPEMPRQQAWGIGLGIIALFQVVPISPGSLVRGLYVLYLVIREKNFKDYNIAVFLGFFKYIGYLAFPIQMTYRYPVLARFMAAHWATDAVHIIPVFGERGALLEHWVFCLFYNWPLTIRRRMRRRSEIRASMRPRYWHTAVCVAVAACGLVAADYAYFARAGRLPLHLVWWWLAVKVPVLFVCSACITLGAGGAPLSRRVVAAVAGGLSLALLHAAAMAAITLSQQAITTGALARSCAWTAFIFAVLAPVAVMLTELKLPDPRAG